jgi:hypothetical protein
MNQELQKIAQQVNLYTDSSGRWVSTESMDQFAQEIVQKCVSIVAHHGVSNFENDDISWVCEKIVKEINEHFGVE